MEKRTALILEISSLIIAACVLITTGLFGYIEFKDKRRLETPVIVGLLQNARTLDSSGTI